MQKWFSIIPNLIVFIFSFLIGPAAANQDKQVSPLNSLLLADSLYEQNKFTEAQALYLQLYQMGYSSDATLLKMAFVNEGLGQTAKALFFLSAYYNQTEDEKAYEKIQTLANARNLSGYELTDSERLRFWLQNRVGVVVPGIACLCLFFMSMAFYFRKKGLSAAKLTMTISLLFLSAILFTAFNFLTGSDKAVVAKPIYFMSGPSAAATFLGMISEGNQVSFSGELDVWAQVQWKGKEGYVKRSDLLMY